MFAIRGATYLLFLVNYALGQGAFGYYLNRTGVPGVRAVGATLFLMGTNLATLLLVTTGVWALRPADPAHVALWWTLLLGTAAFAVYLLVIWLAPRALARVEVLAPLFEARLKGYAIAIIGRLPHTAVLVIGHWLALRTWGIPVPFVAGLTLMPAVVIASVLPISPAGLGTTQAAFVLFFSDYAAGATADERHARVLAFAVVYFVYGVIAWGSSASRARRSRSQDGSVADRVGSGRARAARGRRPTDRVGPRGVREVPLDRLADAVREADRARASRARSRSSSDRSRSGSRGPGDR